MKFIDITTRAARSLRNAKARTLLTSLAIAVGAFTLTATLAAGNGVRAYTDRLISSNFDPSELIVGRDKEVENTGAPNSSPQEYDESIASTSFGGNGTVQLKQVTDEDIKKLEALPYVERVRPNYQIDAKYITRDGYRQYTLSVGSYNPDQKPELAAGSVGSDVRAGEVLIPDSYVPLLGFMNAQDAVGKTVKIMTQQPFNQSTLQSLLSGGSAASLQTDQLQPKQQITSLKIAGVTKPGVANLSAAGTPVLVGANDAKKLYEFTAQGTQQFGKYLYVYATVKGAEDKTVADDAKAKLKDSGYYVLTSQDLQSAVSQIVSIFESLIIVFGLITVVASIFGIINTMYISVLERTREIGLMKALGMRSSSVAWLFRIEAAWIGLIGGVLGSVAAFLVGTAINPWLTSTLNLGEGNSILIFNWAQIVGLVIALTAVAVLAGYFPARKAARLDPIEALRTE